MNEAGEAPDPMPVWFYLVGQEQYGPIDQQQLWAMLGRGQLAPTTLVWHEGMPQWQPVHAVAELGTHMWADQARRASRRATSNCIVMFLLYLLTATTTIVAIFAGPPGPGGPSLVLGCFVLFGLAGSIFSAVYIPRRWRAVISLPRRVAVLGLLGGFGLITFGILFIAQFVAVLTGHVALP